MLVLEANYQLLALACIVLVHECSQTQSSLPLTHSHTQLLMCGMDTVNFEDLKESAVVSGSNQDFLQVLSWFWIVVSSFTQEEMAKLLQFVTGCSQLPPGGFKELNPRFTITSAPTRGRLPTAHTW